LLTYACVAYVIFASPEAEAQVEYPLSTGPS
jgi:hypothetical protein